ncbi:MAG: CBS and ACT domain-containing protein [Erysipelotrichaceae bacterium]|uniref:CBS and ACT domain-containing protein n=1 Tax=Grylomicrobium aquisgranensis TaxID=2926318 RepID=A0AB35U3E0_9FIRM|nr:CBS and ACT domain-containing protein [Lactimicrobium massiliense]MCH4020867.1 CBS and ACT domain-containing protein [Erysipelotrichaceae bacterium]MCI1326576.1 CBS and ACT domain-containing protein [Solobacterium sp.]MDX8420005.1 CBS and ACT domain-containing protein [Stecheria sp. CLA-KB-P133]MCH4044135.1 CBS and ACT domain-containing protein [Erysipelotrichaceae bacterium]MCH4121350.1 CBS and ACT domain-containing protein [Erysipelotrichaceae bacterium]
MYVKDHMTLDPITIDPDVTLLKALEIMGKNHFHRLPVVKDGRLVGLITEGLVNENSGKENTSLSIYELNYLLSRTYAKDIMITDVRTVSPDAWIEDAAEIMLQNEINVLPVVDGDKKVVGIITEKDLFKAFLKLTGYRKQGTRFVIKVEDKPGEFAKICKLFADNDANLENIGVYHSKVRGVETVVRATGEVSVEKMTEVLKDAGFEVVNVWQTKAEDAVK